MISLHAEANGASGRYPHYRFFILEPIGSGRALRVASGVNGVFFSLPFWEAIGIPY